MNSSDYAYEFDSIPDPAMIIGIRSRMKRAKLNIDDSTKLKKEAEKLHKAVTSKYANLPISFEDIFEFVIEVDNKNAIQFNEFEQQLRNEELFILHGLSENDPFIVDASELTACNEISFIHRGVFCKKSSEQETFFGIPTGRSKVVWIFSKKNIQE